MREIRVFVLSIVTSAIIALLVAGLVSRPSFPPAKTVASLAAFDRVINGGKLRCAYISWSASYFLKDPNTGAFQGVGYDLAEALARAMNVKIDWVEEVGVGTMYEGLKNGRYDAVCTPVWQDATGGPHATFTRPAYYSPTYAYARGDDARFDLSDPHAVERINTPEVIVVDVEGSNGVEIHKNHYPKAKTLFLPGMTPAPDIVANVLTKKADITQQNPAFIEDFLKNNPGSLKRVTPALMVFPTSIMVVSKGDERLKEWMDMGIESMIQIGTVDRILDKYDPKRVLFLRANRGYISSIN